MSKIANAIVIGGPIAVGKSTLVGALPFHPIQELDPNDELQKLLLEQMYAGDQIAPQVFQLDILLTRFDKYKMYANEKQRYVFDRMIFEDLFFAKKLLNNNHPHVWTYYHSIWKDKVKEIMEVIGKPRFYILLTCNWETFKRRLFERNRKAEIDNFEKNQQYFKEMIEEYEAFMIEMFRQYDLEHMVIATDDKDILEVIDITKKELAQRGIN